MSTWLKLRKLDKERERELQSLAASNPPNWAWLAEHCLGDGFFRHPLLAAPEGWREQSQSVSLSGLIVDGRGQHAHATFQATARGLS